MKKLNFFCTLAVIFAFVSCNSDSDSILEPIESTESTHTISLEEALANLNDFVNDDATRSGNTTFKIADVVTVSYPSNTRSGNTTNCSSIAYVANFENNQGYAILAADDRIKERVLV